MISKHLKKNLKRDAINLNKFKEIMRNTGYLLINGKVK